jgi:broad specificity phosphatase PhoE
MRHAEKPLDERDPHLSAAGRERAGRLVMSIPRLSGTPDFLFAAADKPGSVRPRETLEPLAAALGLEIDHQVSDKDCEGFAQKLLTEPAFEGKRVVVSWRHDALPALARALGAPPGLCPDPWPDRRYDVVLRFDYEPDGKARASALKEPF